MTTLLDASHVLNPLRGEFISAKHSTFDSVLHDYDPRFTCVYVPQEDREQDLKVFEYAIICMDAGEKPYVVRWLRDEDLNNPAAILAWIWEGDQAKHRKVDILAKLDAEEKFKKAIKMRSEAEEKEQAIELMTVLATGGRERKNFFKHNGKTFRR